MGATRNLPPTLQGLTEQERIFVFSYVNGGNAESAKRDARYPDTTSAQLILRRPSVGVAVRAEIMRLMATEGASIGFNGLKRIAQDRTLPAAAQVAAQKALLQGAGLLDAPQDPKESKSINDMTREELHSYIEGKRAEIDKLEAAIADRARDITPKPDAQPTEMLD